MNVTTIDAAEQADRILALYREIFPGADIGSLIGGEILPGSGAQLELTDPASGQVFARYADAGAAEIDAAMSAAAQAQCEWMAMPAAARGRIMWAIADRIRAHAPLIAEIESRSAGRPIRDIRGEALRVAEMFEYYAGWCDKLYGDVIPVPSSHLNYTRHEPIGVVMQITPWNAPLFTGGWQIAFNDDFSWGGQAPNPANWTNRPWGGTGSGNNSNEIEWIPANNQNVSYANGVLTMQAQNMGSFSAVHAADPTAVSPMANGQTPTYLGSFFTTLPGVAYTYGYAEIYCAFPQGAVSGFWPAFWQVSSLDGWPPEIDTCEFNTGNNAQVHNGYYDMSNTWHNAYYSTSASSYHAYGVALLPGTVAFYLDGVQTYSTSYDGHAFPWSLIMNVAVTTQAGGGYPASMNVQYVRAWTVSGVPAQPVISSISPANGIPLRGASC